MDDGRVDSDQLHGMTYPDLEWCMQNEDILVVDLPEEKALHIAKYKTIRSKNLHKMQPIPVFLKP